MVVEMSSTAVDQQGLFWLPGQSGKDEIAPGRLHITDRRADVELLGALPGTGPAPDSFPDPEVFRYDVLQGVLRDGRYFTFGALVGRRSMGFRFPTVVVNGDSPYGQHIDLQVSYAVADLLTDDIPVFTALRFEMPGLDPILGRHRGVTPFNNIKDLGHVPRFFEDLDDFELRIGTWAISVTSRITGIDEYPVYEIRPDTPQSLQTYVDEIIWPLTWLARFCTQRWESPSELQVEPVLDRERDEHDWPWHALICPGLTRSADTKDTLYDRALFGAETFADKATRTQPATQRERNAALDPYRTMLATTWVEWFTSDPANRDIVRTLLQPAMTTGPVYEEDRFRAFAGALELMSEERVSVGETEAQRASRTLLHEHLEASAPELVEALGGDAEAIAWLERYTKDPKRKGFATLVEELIGLYGPVLETVLTDAEFNGKRLTPKQVGTSIARRRARVSHKTGTSGEDRAAFEWEVTRAKCLVFGAVLADVVDENHWETVASIVTHVSHG